MILKIMRILLWTGGVVLLAGGGVQLYRAHSLLGRVTFFFFLIFILLPAMVLGLAILLSKSPKNKLLHGCGLTGLVGVAAVFLFISYVLEMFMSTRPVSDIRSYEKVLNRWESQAPEMVSHFPQTVPADVSEVDFYFYPGFLQADSEIQLRFRTTGEKIQGYYEHFSDLKTKAGFGMQFIHYLPRESQGQIIQLDEDYEVLWLNPNPEQVIEHSKEYGVIISREKKEIIFWAEW